MTNTAVTNTGATNRTALRSVDTATTESAEPQASARVLAELEAAGAAIRPATTSRSVGVLTQLGRRLANYATTADAIAAECEATTVNPIGAAQELAETVAAQLGQLAGELDEAATELLRIGGAQL